MTDDLTAPAAPVDPASYEWLARAFRRFAREHPDKPAVIETVSGAQISWAEADSRSEDVARAMIDRGVEVGDLVTVALWNSIDFVIADMAAWKAGAVPQPLSQKLSPHEFAAIVEIGKPALVIGDPALAERFGVPMAQIAELAAEGAASSTEVPDVLAPSLKAPTSGGSTGRPKIILSGVPAVADDGSLDLWRHTPDTIALITAPMHHNAPHSAMFQTLARGGTVVLMERFDAEQVLVNIEKYRINFLYVVPIMMHRMWNLPEEVKARYDHSSIETIWHMGAPCPAWLKARWIEWFGAEPMMELYAGTEAQAVTVINGVDWLTHPGSVGPVVSGEMVILDDDHNPVPAGTEGEVWMRRAPEKGETYQYIGADAKRLDRGDGIIWESLGDVGQFDEDGYLYLHDRKTDMILVGGVNVFPAEIEAALQLHPSIHSSAVIGLPDEEYGNRIHAIVHADAGVDLDDVRRHLAEELSPHKLPRTIEVTDEPLRDDAGKSRRSALRAERLPAP